MTDDLTRYLSSRNSAAARPLRGQTVLVVEDSRFASEALRLMCLYSGARIRRADCLLSARRHLRTYRPHVVIVDMGLPDGSGADLIRDIAAGAAGPVALFGLSGDPAREAEAREAGAAGFLVKPLESIADFQKRLLAALPLGDPAQADPAQADSPLVPDPLALRDDLTRAMRVLDAAPAPPEIGYIADFLFGIASIAGDEALHDAARTLRSRPGTGLALSQTVSLLRARIAATPSL